MIQEIKIRKKLIEIALPLEAINKASVREGYIYRGNPSALHKWWAQRPLAAARAVIFAQMVDDPSTYVETLLDVSETRRASERELKKRKALWDSRTDNDRGPEPTLEDCAADIERQRLFRIIEEIVLWENTANEQVLDKARAEIWQSWRRACADNVGIPQAKELFDRNVLPAFHDPFAGGGALPLEAQRLGLKAYASDLNPVAVLINKAMIEIPTKFAGIPPVNPTRDLHKHWKGAQGLADDVRHYGEWMRAEAHKRIGHLYPKIEVTTEMTRERPDLKPLIGQKLTVIACLWARTVKSPNPAFREIDVPLATFMLSSKAGKEAYVEPIIEKSGYRFDVRVGKPKEMDRVRRGTKSGGSGSGFFCLMSGTPMPFDYLRHEAKAGRMGTRLLAVVAEGARGRVYLSPTDSMEAIAKSAIPSEVPETELPLKALGFRVQEYGMTRWRDLYTPRQLVALTTLSQLVTEVRDHIRRDAAATGLKEGTPLSDGGVGAVAYAEAVSTYLAFAEDKTAEYGCTIVPWYTKEDRPKGLFARQAIPMVWDFAEVNPLCDIGGSFAASVGIVAGALAGCVANGPTATVLQLDAVRTKQALGAVVSTDPPYYDNIGYADLSDFFYVWLRSSMKTVYPELFATVAVPKAEELVATPYRHGSKDAAEKFFLDGMTQVMHSLAEQAHPAFPITIYYAFKQSESETEAGTASTGWETFLDAVIRAGLGLLGTWPMRTERGGRSIGIGTNALASSIVLVCRSRPENAPTVARRDFLNSLKSELPESLRQLQRGNIAPVDLAQAAIGPGMAILTRYAKVVDADGKTLTVREALALINEVLDEVLAEQEGDFDADSRFAIAWFEQFGFAEGEFGVADVLARAKVTSVAAMADPRYGGVLLSKGGKVRLLRPDELPDTWDPATDERLTIWEIVHHLIRVLEKGGEAAAGHLVAKLGVKADPARELAYRLFTVAERKKRAQEALSYNGLVQSWPEISRLARDSVAAGTDEPPQSDMFGRA